MTVQELLKLIEGNGVTRVDLRVSDLLGRWQHFTVSPDQVKEDLFENGSGFDGSSLRGFQEIHESDMLLMPDIESARIDPIPAASTVAMICSVMDPITRERYTRDPRNVARKAEEYLASTGIADLAYFGPEAELRAVSMPIAEQVHAILFEDKPARAAVLDLMRREVAGEMDGVLEAR